MSNHCDLTFSFLSFMHFSDEGIPEKIVEFIFKGFWSNTLAGYLSTWRSWRDWRGSMREHPCLCDERSVVIYLHQIKEGNPALDHWNQKIFDRNQTIFGWSQWLRPACVLPFCVRQDTTREQDKEWTIERIPNYRWPKLLEIHFTA